jgi:hypothetical protein
MQILGFRCTSLLLPPSYLININDTDPGSSRWMISLLDWFILSAFKSALKIEETTSPEMLPGTSRAAFSSVYVIVKRYLIDIAGGFAMDAGLIASDGVGWRSTRPSGSLNGPASEILSLRWPGVSISLARAARQVHTNVVVNSS